LFIIFPLFPCIYYSAVQYTLYHVSVCTVLLPVLYMPIWCVPLSQQNVYILHLLSVYDCISFVAWYLVWNAWSSTAIISLPVSPFRSPLNTYNNLSSPPISCLSTLLMYWPCSSSLSHFVFKESTNFLLRVECLHLLSHRYLLIGF